MDFAAVPLHAFGSNDTIAATAGVDTGLVDLAGFADSNSQANFYTTKYQVTINWNDPNATASNPNTVTFIGKQKMTVGYVTGSADDWEIYAHHLYAKAGSYPIVITVVKDPPAVGGAGKETLTLHATIVVKALPPPSLVMRSKYLLLSIAGQSPQSSPDAFMAQFTPVLTEPYTAYTFTVNWGDGQTSSPAFREAPGHQPDPGQGILIMDNHVYASGGPPGMPEYYTVTVTITGPGIDPKSPLTGTSIAPVLGQA